MQVKWIITLASLWILGLLLGGVTESVYFMGQDMALFDTFFTFKVVNFINPSWYIEWMNLLVKMFIFDYSFFTSTWYGQIVQYFFIAVSVGIATLLIIEVARIVASITPG